jgi:phosphoribosylaminoimidazolecarboxamide formyltransferase/IMP cyclohydrolase
MEKTHQGFFSLKIDIVVFSKLHGKRIIIHNLLDVDAAVNLMSEFQNDDPTFGCSLKHNNACGIANEKKQ